MCNVAGERPFADRPLSPSTPKRTMPPRYEVSSCVLARDVTFLLGTFRAGEQAVPVAIFRKNGAYAACRITCPNHGTDVKSWLVQRLRAALDGNLTACRSDPVCRESFRSILGVHAHLSHWLSREEYRELLARIDGADQSGETRAAAVGHGPNGRPDLTSVVKAWPHLSDMMRREITALALTSQPPPIGPAQSGLGSPAANGGRARKRTKSRKCKTKVATSER